MKKYLIVLSLFVSIVSSGQQKIVVEKVKLTETVDKRYVSEIPRVRDLSNEENPIVQAINSEILERFMINSFNQNEIEEFRWYEVTFRSEIKHNILYIGFAGEHYGAYPNYVEDTFYFDLQTGKLLIYPVIPLQALFSLTGYLDFLNRFWLKEIKEEFKKAIECANLDPYCSFYDIYDYSVKENKLSMSLRDDCYPLAVRSCAPFYGISIPLDTLKPYLNDVGKQILFESDYHSKSEIDKFIENKRLKERIPNNYFVFGKIDDKYPFSMALNFNDLNNNTIGYYYYDKNLQKLNLKGQKKGELILLTETLNKKITGFFELSLSKTYDSKAHSIYHPHEESMYLSGKWFFPDKSKAFDINFTEVKMNDRN